MGRQNAGARRGPPANAKFGPQMLGKLPEIMRRAMQGDARAQMMLGKLHKKIASVLKASKQKNAKKHVGNQAPRIRIARVGGGDAKGARFEVLEVEVDRRRVQLELARRDMKKRQMDMNAQKHAPKHAPKRMKRAKKSGEKKVTDRDVERMRELTRKSRKLQEEIRRLRAELSKMK